MKTFKRNTALVFLDIIAFVPFLLLVFLFDTNGGLYFIITLITFLSIYILNNSRIVEINISNKEIIITHFHLGKKINSYNTEDLMFEMNQEMVGRSVSQNILRLYNKGNLIAKLKPSFSGWNEKDIIEIHNLLSNIQKNGSEI